MLTAQPQANKTACFTEMDRSNSTMQLAEHIPNEMLKLKQQEIK